MTNVSIQYDLIATEFDKTRIRIWNNVKEFLHTYKNANNLLLDAGCGNGKNMIYANELGYKTHGIDFSNKLVKICVEKGLDVKQCDILAIETEQDTKEIYDNIICIAVIHHLDDLDKQKRAILNLLYLLKNNGELLISVWSLEKTLHESDKYEKSIKDYRNFVKGHNLIPWNSRYNKSDSIDRYYYIHDKESFKELIDNIASECNIEYTISFEKQNWFCKFCKIIKKI